MTESILLEDLIDVFVAAVKAKRPRIEISRKYNQLTPFLGPIELHGLMEMWEQYAQQTQTVYPHVFEETVAYLKRRYRGVKIYPSANSVYYW